MFIYFGFCVINEMGFVSGFKGLRGKGVKLLEFVVFRILEGQVGCVVYILFIYKRASGIILSSLTRGSYIS